MMLVVLRTLPSVSVFRHVLRYRAVTRLQGRCAPFPSLRSVPARLSGTVNASP